jgi:hypothetical protein
MVAGAERDQPGASTPGKDEARKTITRTTITPAPGTEESDRSTKPTGPKESLLGRMRGPGHGELAAAQKPFEGPSTLRFIMSVMLTLLCLLTVGGAMLLLLLWQQERASGVLTTQVERTWDLFELLRQVERWLAFAVIPIALAWLALGTLNVRRATGQFRNPVIAAGSLVVGLAGVWMVGSEIVAEADDWLGKGSGFVLQVVFLAIPLLAIERVTDSAEARHRPIRATFVIAVLYVAHLQFLGGLSTVDQTSGADEWGPLGAYLVIGALLQVLGALSANEAARSIEEGTDNRYQLRQRFGESLLAQAVRG